MDMFHFKLALMCMLYADVGSFIIFCINFSQSEKPPWEVYNKICVALYCMLNNFFLFSDENLGKIGSCILARFWP